jgi:hypothetical protein
MTPDFLVSASDADTTCDMRRLAELVREYKNLQEQVQVAEDTLKLMKANFARISGEEIPAFLAQAGLTEVKLYDGSRVTVTEGISVTVKDQESFSNFLASRGEESIIKSSYNCEKLGSAERSAIANVLEKMGVAYTTDDKVHPQTLKKYFRELLGVGKQPDQIEAGIQKGEILPREKVEVFAQVYNYLETKIK